jgi:CRP/FNR family transcriptional regulator
MNIAATSRTDMKARSVPVPNSQDSVRDGEATPASEGDYRSEYSVIPNFGRVSKTQPSAIETESLQSRAFAGTIGDDLSREDRQQIYQIATTLIFPTGTRIFSEGADAHFIYFIDQGIVQLSRLAENGHRQILGFQVAGDLIGFVHKGQYANLAETISTVRVERVAWSQMLCLMLADPKLQLAVMKKLVHDLLQAQSLIMVLGQQNTHQRLASCLVTLLKVPQFFDEQTARLRLPANRFDLANYLGVSPGSAARAFARLEKQWLVRRVTPRLIEILDVDGLKRLQLDQRRRHPMKNANSAESQTYADPLWTIER